MSIVEDAIRTGVTKGVNLIAGYNRRRMADETAPHPYLSGVHEPMKDERTLTELQVTGVIPHALDGRYLRIGPNPVAPEPAGHHWFVGDGMVHGVALKDGKALWYRNRWVRSRHVSRVLGEPPAPGPRHEPSDNANTNVIAVNGRTFALVEAGAYPVELADDLETVAHNPFDGSLKGAFTAHPHRDPLTGEHHAITYQGDNPSTVHHVVLTDEGRVVREEPIPVRDGPSIHDCGLTARYVLVFDLNVTFSMKAVVGGHTFPYAWNAGHQGRVGLLPRKRSASDIIWCDVDPCYVFHVANAYDAPDGRVIVDLVVYDRMFADSLKGPDSVGRLERWTINPQTQAVDRRVIDASGQEFPRPDERRFGQPYRYAYAIAIAADTKQFGGETRLYKHDLDAGGRQVHDFGPKRHPGEFVFVPSTPDAAEDEGWLIGLVVDLGRDVTDLVILDAQAFEAEPLASIRIPHRVPAGFHGNWLAAAPAG